MTYTADELYGLLPVALRRRDAADGGALRELVGVLAEQALVVHDDITRMYDDLFVETAAPWVVPYIGDLLDVSVNGGEAATVRTARAEVANTIAYRRRKGTAYVLEALATDVTGMPAVAIEFFLRLAVTQSMHHIRPDSVGNASLRSARALAFTDTPFDILPRTVDVRRPATLRGWHSIAGLGVALWQQDVVTMTASAARALDGRRWCFDPLGRDIGLMHAADHPQDHQRRSRMGVPHTIGRRDLHADASYYVAAPGRFDPDLTIVVDGVALDADEIVAADLSSLDATTWAHQPAAGAFVDPELGRLALAAPAASVTLQYRHGVPGLIGGGPYERASSFTDVGPRRPIAAGDDLAAALAVVHDDAVVEVIDGRRVTSTITIEPGPNARQEIRAANGVVVWLDGVDVVIDGTEAADVTLNGMIITGRLLVRGTIGRVSLVHCTVAPSVDEAIIVDTESVTLMLDACIVGGIRSGSNTTIVAMDSVIDAGSTEAVAIDGRAGDEGSGTVDLHGVTVIGRVHVRRVVTISNSLVRATGAPDGRWRHPLRADRRQEGCVRYSVLPADSILPRPHACSTTDQASAVPVFVSLVWGHPAYLRLHPRTGAAVMTGADDGAEVGAWHHRRERLLVDNLRYRLEEYRRVSMELGILVVDHDQSSRIVS